MFYLRSSSSKSQYESISVVRLLKKRKILSMQSSTSACVKCWWYTLWPKSVTDSHIRKILVSTYFPFDTSAVNASANVICRLRPNFFKWNLNAACYLGFLCWKLVAASFFPIIKMTTSHQNIWFQQNRTFGTEVRRYLDELFPRRCIGGN